MAINQVFCARKLVIPHQFASAELPYLFELHRVCLALTYKHFGMV